MLICAFKGSPAEGGETLGVLDGIGTVAPHLAAVVAGGIGVGSLPRADLHSRSLESIFQAAGEHCLLPTCYLLCCIGTVLLPICCAAVLLLAVRCFVFTTSTPLRPLSFC